MTVVQIPDGEIPGTLPQKSMIAFNIVLLVLCVVVLVYFRGQAFIDGLGRISDGHICASVSNGDIPVFFSIPSFLSFAVSDNKCNW